MFKAEIDLTDRAMSSGRWYAMMQYVRRPAPASATSIGYPAVANTTVSPSATMKRSKNRRIACSGDMLNSSMGVQSSFRDALADETKREFKV